MPFKKQSASNSLSLVLKKLPSVSNICCCAALSFSSFFKWSHDTMWISSHSVFHSSKPHCLQLQKTKGGGNDYEKTIKIIKRQNTSRKYL